MDNFFIVLIIVGWVLLAAGVGLSVALGSRDPKPLPPGYELRTISQKYINVSKYGSAPPTKELGVAPTYLGVFIANGYEFQDHGYKKAVKLARRAIFLHAKNQIDRENP